MKKKIVISSVSVIFLITALAIVAFGPNESSVSKVNDPMIAIDPGHGGPKAGDKGYTSLSGIHECTLNNSVARMLAEILEQRGYKVIFTKEPDDDITMPLQQRPVAANKANADILVSIHHDANANTERNGFWIFYSSYKINLDDKDLIVLYEGKEYSLVSETIKTNRFGVTYAVNTITNGTDTFTVNNIDHYYRVIDKTPCGAAVESEILAEAIYEQMLGLTYIKPKSIFEKTVVDEEYRVLRYSNMPSVLIEAGFMTNPSEMKEVQQDENQLELAYAIADGIDAYFGRE